MTTSTETLLFDAAPLRSLFEHYRKHYFDGHDFGVDVDLDWSTGLRRLAGSTQWVSRKQIRMRLAALLLQEDEVNLADMNTKSVLLHEMIHAYLMTHKDGDVRRSQDEFEHPSAFTAKCAEILSKSNEQTGGVFDDGQRPAQGYILRETHQLDEAVNQRSHGFQCLGCGMEEWRFKSASPCTFNCPLRQAKGSTRWRAPSHYQTAYKEWEEDEGLTPEPLCFDFGSPLPCSHHQHMWKHRRSADTDNTLGPLQWFKVAEPADKPTSKMGGSAQPGSPQPLWVKYHSRQAVILDLAGLDASTGDEIRQVLQKVYVLERPPILDVQVTHCTTDLVVLLAASDSQDSSPPELDTAAILEGLQKLGPYAHDANVDRINLVQLRNGLATKRISITAMCRTTAGLPGWTSCNQWQYKQFGQMPDAQWRWKQVAKITELRLLKTEPRAEPRRNPSRRATAAAQADQEVLHHAGSKRPLT